MTRPTVLVLNGSEDLLAVLSELLVAEGLHAVCVRIPDLERGRENFSQRVQEFDPAAIVYDVSVPFGRSWAVCQELILDAVKKAVQQSSKTPRVNVASAQKLANEPAAAH